MLPTLLSIETMLQNETKEWKDTDNNSVNRQTFQILKLEVSPRPFRIKLGKLWPTGQIGLLPTFIGKCHWNAAAPIRYVSSTAASAPRRHSWVVVTVCGLQSLKHYLAFSEKVVTVPNFTDKEKAQINVVTLSTVTWLDMGRTRTKIRMSWLPFKAWMRQRK